MTAAVRRDLLSDLGRRLVFIAEVLKEGELLDADKQPLSRHELEILRNVAHMLNQALAATAQSMDAQVGLMSLTKSVTALVSKLTGYTATQSLETQAKGIREGSRDVQKKLDYSIQQLSSVSNDGGLKQSLISGLGQLRDLEPKGKIGNRVSRVVKLRSDKVAAPVQATKLTSSTLSGSAQLIPFAKAPANSASPAERALPSVPSPLRRSHSGRHAAFTALTRTEGKASLSIGAPVAPIQKEARAPSQSIGAGAHGEPHKPAALAAINAAPTPQDKTASTKVSVAVLSGDSQQAGQLTTPVPSASREIKGAVASTKGSIASTAAAKAPSVAAVSQAPVDVKAAGMELPASRNQVVSQASPFSVEALSAQSVLSSPSILNRTPSVGSQFPMQMPIASTSNESAIIASPVVSNWSTPSSNLVTPSSVTQYSSAPAELMAPAPTNAPSYAQFSNPIPNADTSTTTASQAHAQPAHMPLPAAAESLLTSPPPSASLAANAVPMNEPLGVTNSQFPPAPLSTGSEESKGLAAAPATPSPDLLPAIPDKAVGIEPIPTRGPGTVELASSSAPPHTPSAPNEPINRFSEKALATTQTLEFPPASPQKLVDNGKDISTKDHTLPVTNDSIPIKPAKNQTSSNGGNPAATEPGGLNQESIDARKNPLIGSSEDRQEQSKTTVTTTDVSPEKRNDADSIEIKGQEAINPVVVSPPSVKDGVAPGDLLPEKDPADKPPVNPIEQLKCCKEQVCGTSGCPFVRMAENIMKEVPTPRPSLG